MPRPTPGLAAGLAVLSLAVAACGTQGSESAAPSESTTPSASPTASSSPSATATTPSVADTPGLVALDDDKGLGSPGYWGVKLTGGWDPVVLDQQGRNQIKDPKTGCSFTTQQSNDRAEPGGDASLSRALVAQQAQALAEQAGATPSAVSTLVVPRGAIVAVKGGVELATARVTYTRQDTGKKATSVLAGRRFTSTDTVLLAVLNCPTSLIPTKAAAEAAFRKRGTISTQ